MKEIITLDVVRESKGRRYHGWYKGRYDHKAITQIIHNPKTKNKGTDLVSPDSKPPSGTKTPPSEAQSEEA